MNKIKVISEISPDGSDRIFQRTEFNHKTAVFIKPSQNPKGITEAISYYNIGRHLYKKGIPVPEIYSFNNIGGEILVEDLGDEKFFDALSNLSSDNKKQNIFTWYERIVRELACMQVKGGEDFNPDWCYDTQYYDEHLAFNRECLYFINSFLVDYLKLNIERLSPLKEELFHFANNVKNFERRFFLHRDFQSRNLMIFNENIRIIDFQGGRLGPLGYDLASLLIDPYAQIDRSFWIDLIKIYLDELSFLNIKKDFDILWNEFLILSLLRNMQVLGAFSFLSKIKNKAFFSVYIIPALDNLRYLLSLYNKKELKNLSKTLDDISII